MTGPDSGELEIVVALEKAFEAYFSSADNVKKYQEKRGQLLEKNRNFSCKHSFLH
jgi:hypothetical protein